MILSNRIICRQISAEDFLTFDAYIRLDPEDADTYFNRAYEYDELGEHQLTIKDLDEAIKLDPQYAKACYNRGVAYQNLGKRNESDRDFEKAKELGFEP